MNNFTIYTKDSAPEESRELLLDSEKAFGMVPNLHGVMAQAPGLLKTYQVAHELIGNSSFSKEELTVVWQSINVEHSCHYCVPAHTAIAKGMSVSDDISQALRNETPLAEIRLEALRTFTLTMVRERGEVSSEQLQKFLDAGFNNRHVLEVVLAIAQKVMSNYTNHLAKTPIDKPFEEFGWEKKK